MNENEILQEDEISLFDLWEQLREGWKKVLGGLLVGILGAVLLLAATPPKYEARAMLKIGTVAGTAFEAAEVLVQRLQSPAFRLEVARKSGDERLVESLIQDAATGKEFIKSTIIKGTQMIDLVVSSSSPQQAEKLGGYVIAGVDARHELLGSTIRKKIMSDIDISKEKLKVAEAELLELVHSTVLSKSIKDSQLAPVSLLTSLRVQKQSEAFGLLQQLTSLELSLLPPATQPTIAIEGIYVAQKPVSPKRGLLLTLGAIGGLMIGVLWVFVTAAWRRAKAAKAANS